MLKGWAGHVGRLPSRHIVQATAMNIDGFACRSNQDAAVMVEGVQRGEVFRKANNSAGGRACSVAIQPHQARRLASRPMLRLIRQRRFIPSHFCYIKYGVIGTCMCQYWPFEWHRKTIRQATKG